MVDVTYALQDAALEDEKEEGIISSVKGLNERRQYDLNQCVMLAMYKTFQIKSSSRPKL